MAALQPGHLRFLLVCLQRVPSWGEPALRASLPSQVPAPQAQPDYFYDSDPHLHATSLALASPAAQTEKGAEISRLVPPTQEILHMR